MATRSQVPPENSEDMDDEGFQPAARAKPISLNNPPPKVKGVNRIMVIVLVGVITAAIFLAFSDTLRKKQAKREDMNKQFYPATTPDNLGDLPSDYTGIKKTPKLGPPKPGELGQTKLDFERGLEQQAQSGGRDFNQQSDEEKEREAQRIAKLKRAAAAASSGMSFGMNAGGGGMNGGGPTQGIAELAQKERALKEALDNLNALQAGGSPPPSARDDDNRQDDKHSFVSKKRTADPYLQQGVVTPPSPYFVGAGAIIPAVLLTGINSDLPGQITGQVSQNVYDTMTGRYLLIPQGTVLIGEYDSKITYGQERVLIVWSRLRRPDGKSISLEGMPGVDLSGYAGVTDQVNNHWGKLLGGVLLGSLMGAGAQMAHGSSLNLENPGFGQLALQGAATNINQAGQEMTRKNLKIQPTLEIRPGFRFNVFVTKDMELPVVGL
jgi:type IV secretion system protein TrbI